MLSLPFVARGEVPLVQIVCRASCICSDPMSQGNHFVSVAANARFRKQRLRPVPGGLRRGSDTGHGVCGVQIARCNQPECSRIGFALTNPLVKRTAYNEKVTRRTLCSSYKGNPNSPDVQPVGRALPWKTHPCRAVGAQTRAVPFVRPWTYLLPQPSMDHHPPYRERSSGRGLHNDRAILSIAVTFLVVTLNLYFNVPVAMSNVNVVLFFIRSRHFAFAGSTGKRACL